MIFPKSTGATIPEAIGSPAPIYHCVLNKAGDALPLVAQLLAQLAQVLRVGRVEFLIGLRPDQRLKLLLKYSSQFILFE